MILWKVLYTYDNRLLLCQQVDGYNCVSWLLAFSFFNLTVIFPHTDQLLELNPNYKRNQQSQMNKSTNHCATKPHVATLLAVDVIEDFNEVIKSNIPLMYKLIKKKWIGI